MTVCKNNSVLLSAILLTALILSSLQSISADTIPPFSKGERIVYDIKKLRMTAGTSTMEVHGETTYEGQPAFLITVVADGFNFYDGEKIYLDPATFLPIAVERDVNVFGKKEKISERYEQTSGTITIVKEAGGTTTTQVIKKEAPVENIYGFIYRYRMQGTFKVGEKLLVNLPTREVVITLVKKTKIKVGNEQREAYFMQSDPKQFTIWFDATKERVPLRIDGAVGFGSTSMFINPDKSLSAQDTENHQ